MLKSLAAIIRISFEGELTEYIHVSHRNRHRDVLADSNYIRSQENTIVARADGDETFEKHIRTRQLLSFNPVKLLRIHRSLRATEDGRCHDEAS